MAWAFVQPTPRAAATRPFDLSQRIAHDDPSFPHAQVVLKAHHSLSTRSCTINRLALLHFPIRLCARPSATTISAHTDAFRALLLITVHTQHTTITNLCPLTTMASTMFDSNQTLFQQLEQAKQSFWSSNAHLSEEQRQQLWLQAASLSPSNTNTNSYSSSHASVAHQTPRSLPAASNMTHLPVWMPPFWSTLSLL
jgi:hypothetical protein